MDPEQAALEDLVREKRISEIYSLRQSVQQLEEDIARGIAARRLGGDPAKAYLLLVKSYVRSLETLLSDLPRWSNDQVGAPARRDQVRDRHPTAAARRERRPRRERDAPGCRRRDRRGRPDGRKG